MSNIVKRNLLKSSLKSTVTLTSRRCFSVSGPIYKQHEEGEEADESKVRLLPNRIEDIIADFEKPLIDPLSTHNESDPRATLIEAVEKFKPRENVISTNNMNKLRSHINNSYNVGQLGTILTAHHLPKKGLKKQQLISSIIEKHWGIKTTEQAKQEAIQKQLDIIKQRFPASRQELFFIIGDNGNTIRNIEQENQVKVTIDVSSNLYIVEGPSAAVAKAKREILTHLNIREDSMDLPKQVFENQELRNEISNAMIDISKVAGTFITLKDDKFSLASVSDDAMDNAKRLLSLMLTELNVTNKKGLDQPNNTIVHNNSEFTVLPLHDSTSMSLYNRKLNWNRIESNRPGDGSTFRVLNDGQEIGSMDNIKDILLKPFEQEKDLNNVSMEARFGNVLFQNQRNSNITNKASSTTSSTTELLNLYKNRSIFFNTMPPRQLTSPFIPLILDGGFHQRSVQLRYFNKSLLATSNNNDNEEVDLKRLDVEFVVGENGDIALKNMIGIKNQSVIDILGAYGNVDIRLLANQFIDYSNNDDLKEFMIDQCKLTSYSELSAPRNHKDMILSDITFLNKKIYLFDKSLVSINHIEQQDKRAKRTELIVNSVDPETLNMTNSIERWPSFSNILSNIAHNWKYST